MKKLLAFLAMMTFSSSALAATLERLDEMSDAQLETFADLAEAIPHNGDNMGVVTRFAFTPRSEGESVTPTIKQIIYRTRGGGYSRPDSVEVKLTRGATGRKALAAAATTFAAEGQQKRLARQLERALEGLTSVHDDLTLYVADDGNSFGLCKSAVIVDKQAKEILVVSSCYAE